MNQNIDKFINRRFFGHFYSLQLPIKVPNMSSHHSIRFFIIDNTSNTDKYCSNKMHFLSLFRSIPFNVIHSNIVFGGNDGKPTGMTLNAETSKSEQGYVDVSPSASFNDICQYGFLELFKKRHMMNIQECSSSLSGGFNPNSNDSALIVFISTMSSFDFSVLKNENRIKWYSEHYIKPYDRLVFLDMDLKDSQIHDISYFYPKELFPFSIEYFNLFSIYDLQRRLDLFMKPQCRVFFCLIIEGNQYRCYAEYTYQTKLFWPFPTTKNNTPIPIYQAVVSNSSINFSNIRADKYRLCLIDPIQLQTGIQIILLDDKNIPFAYIPSTHEPTLVVMPYNFPIFKNSLKDSLEYDEYLKSIPIAYFKNTCRLLTELRISYSVSEHPFELKEREIINTKQQFMQQVNSVSKSNESDNSRQLILNPSLQKLFLENSSNGHKLRNRRILSNHILISHDTSSEPKWSQLNILLSPIVYDELKQTISYEMASPASLDQVLSLIPQMNTVIVEQIPESEPNPIPKVPPPVIVVAPPPIEEKSINPFQLLERISILIREREYTKIYDVLDIYKSDEAFYKYYKKYVLICADRFDQTALLPKDFVEFLSR